MLAENPIPKLELLGEANTTPGDVIRQFDKEGTLTNGNWLVVGIAQSLQKDKSVRTAAITAQVDWTFEDGFLYATSDPVILPHDTEIVKVGMATPEEVQMTVSMLQEYKYIQNSSGRSAEQPDPEVIHDGHLRSLALNNLSSDTWTRFRSYSTFDRGEFYPHEQLRSLRTRKLDK